MNAVTQDKTNQTATPIDESKLPISQVSEEERQRRTMKLQETAEKISKEARNRGLTDEILEDLLKEI
jgi:hypothetical protein